MDRTSPAQRPRRPALMVQDWHYLLFLHWVVAVEQLRPLVPIELDLDTFDGAAYVGLVPFTITGVRPPFAPALGPLSQSHEVNLRTYVHLGGADPGVWFFSLDASNPFAVLSARAFFKLPYFLARMELREQGGAIDYFSERQLAGPGPAGCRLRYRSVGTPSPAEPGTLEYFLVERYVLYARSGDRLYRGRVHHRPYPLQAAETPAIEETLLAAAGIRRPAGEPLMHYARGVHVEVFGLERVR
ncbi:MAG TPA: DUF2071 domain-containing protein [Myxococcaceae bacterium]|nr:DUF2071 domain-containing protein [Myxococcaceae bacterium]